MHVFESMLAGTSLEVEYNSVSLWMLPPMFP